YSTPTVAGDAVFFGSQDKHYYCLDRATGKERWKFKTSARVEAGSAYRDGKVYFGGTDGIFHCVDAKTGASVWSFETPKPPGAGAGAIYCAPVLAGDAVCFGSFDGHLYARDAATGKPLWAFRPVNGAEIDSVPCVVAGRIFI